MKIESFEVGGSPGRGPDRERWLALRRADVTASDLGAVCGVDRYRTPLQVYAEKAGRGSRIAESNLMRRGRWLEPAVLLALKERRPAWEIRKATVYLRAPELRIGATPDLVVVDPEREGLGVVQVKVVNRRSFLAGWLEEDDDGHGLTEDDVERLRPPLAYELQTLAERKLVGASWSMLAALVVSEFAADLYLVEVPNAETAWDRAVEEVRYFWEAFDAGRAPDIRGGEDGATMLQLYPTPTKGAIDLSQSNLLPMLLAERKVLNAATKANEARVDEIENEVRAIMGPHAVGTLPGWEVRWRTEPRKGFTVEPCEPRVLRILPRKLL